MSIIDKKLSYFNILVFVIWYKGEVVDAFGLKTVYDDVIISLPKSIFDQITGDKETFDPLPAQIQTNIKTNKARCNICNTHANKACGTYGNLILEIVKRSVAI